MLQFLSKKLAKATTLNPTHGSGWMLQIRSSCRQHIRTSQRFFISRVDLNNPPTAVGGILLLVNALLSSKDLIPSSQFRGCYSTLFATPLRVVNIFGITRSDWMLQSFAARSRHYCFGGAA